MRIFRKEIIDHRTVWRIFAGRFVRWQWRVGVEVRANAQSSLRFKQEILALVPVELPQRRDVVENPKPATMRRHDEIVVLNNKIAHGTRWQIQSQRLPVRAVIERDINAFFGSGEQETFPFRIFANCVDDLAGRYSVRNLRPRFAGVVRRKNARPQIIDPQRVDRRLSRVGSAMSGFDQRNLLPRRNTCWRYVGPGFSAIAREMD